ncbi:MAG TPA: helix-turn-helix domain-containing protein [Candidatus Omnitrophota bacterium]|nr:helix-turn-helix domain-containing protein [Candidatus Omnitrophota bacterium]HPT39082.1 helix-turn-helix domain-containing protein [Candidatus Omnitrophota bacterium]
MITIVISESDEGKVKELLNKILKEEGYDLSESLAQGNVIRLAHRDNIRDLAFIKDKAITLGDSWYSEKRGQLYKSVLFEIEKPLIEHVLERTEGNQLKAAKILGMNRNTMRAKIKKLGIDPDQWKI